MKICPVCKLQARADATDCVQCGHKYRTLFTAPTVPPQTQQVAAMRPVQGHIPQPPQPFTYSGPIPIPPAPTPPTVWEQFKNPLAQSKYRAELLAYMNATGAITDQHKKQAAKFMLFVYVAFGIMIAWMVFDFIRGSIKSNEETDKMYQQMHEDQQRFRNQFPGGAPN